MKQLESIDQIPQIPMTAWEMADLLFGKAAVNANHSLASRAAEQMRQAGWCFLEYDNNGDEVWEPPKEAKK